MKTGFQRFFARPAAYAGVAIASGLFLFVGGELALRVIYADGLSFGSRAGPIAERFERDMQINRFGGRGPEAIGPKAPNEVRLLIQGDSITWGQGVKDEDDLYPALLLERLQALDLKTTAAVLARPGREIDEHLEQIREWGDDVSPDVIIYQWYINDIELDKSRRPRSDRPWRKMYFHDELLRRSYLYFLLDYRLDLWLPSDQIGYTQYIEDEHSDSAQTRQLFVQYFRAWAEEAHRLTPRVMLVMYPHLTSESHFAGIHRWIEQICREESIVTVDLLPWFEKWSDDYTATYASQFDGHPNAAVHEQISVAIGAALSEAWPDLFHSQSAGRM